jgi:hypothetical protein
VPPTSANASALIVQNGRAEKKRQREEEAAEGERKAKRDKADDDDDEEMEIDDEEDHPQNGNACTSCVTFNLHLLHNIFPGSWGAARGPSNSAFIMYKSTARGIRWCFICSVPTVSLHLVPELVFYSILQISRLQIYQRHTNRRPRRYALLLILNSRN